MAKKKIAKKRVSKKKTTTRKKRTSIGSYGVVYGLHNGMGVGNAEA